ncbi:hypothetical protein MTP99_016322 [Tenebrio molitor]|jgi:hypothetical protein|nr:hypothetical protein MTP99_016322 [Tenebrio molitor]
MAFDWPTKKFAKVVNGAGDLRSAAVPRSERRSAPGARPIVVAATPPEPVPSGGGDVESPLIEAFSNKIGRVRRALLPPVRSCG